jgi:hypothetical protein
MAARGGELGAPEGCEDHRTVPHHGRWYPEIVNFLLPSLTESSALCVVATSRFTVSLTAFLPLPHLRGGVAGGGDKQVSRPRLSQSSSEPQPSPASCFRAGLV